MEVMRELYLFQLKQRHFILLTYGRIETEKHSDHLLRPKKKKKGKDITCVFWHSKILFPWDVDWLHNYSETVFIATRSCSEAYLPEAWCLVCGSPLAWKYWSCLSWPVLIPNILVYIRVTPHSINLFCKKQKLWPGCGRTLYFILLRSQHTTHRKERAKITCLLLLLKIEEFATVDLSVIFPVKCQHTSEVTKNAIFKYG